MNVSGFLSGNFLTQLDLPAPSQIWTISKTEQKLVGTDTKICLTFSEFPSKPLGANKTNLKRVAGLYGLDASLWTKRQLRVYRSTTAYGGKVMPCVRVVGPQQEPIDDHNKPIQPVALQSAVPAPAPMPVQQAVAPVQPVAVPVQQQVAPAQQPVAVPAPGAPVAVQQQPVAASAQQSVEAPQQPVTEHQTPWEQDLANQQNSPPSE